MLSSPCIPDSVLFWSKIFQNFLLIFRPDLYHTAKCCIWSDADQKIPELIPLHSLWQFPG